MIGNHAYVQELPKHFAGKDYSDMRMNGWSPTVARLSFKPQGVF